MDAPPRSWFGTLQAAFVLLAASLLVAVPVTWLRYSRTHLDGQGVDLVHHLIIAHEVGEPGAPDAVLGFLSDYPSASHRPAAWAAPLFGGDSLAALRYATVVTMLALLVLPYVLLCRVFPPLPALALVSAWHLVCYYLQVGGLNHFMWDAVFNYSRAVGTVGFWMALVALSAPCRNAWPRFGAQCLAAGCACFALACHIAPGAVAFGAVLACQAAWWLRERTWARAAAFAVTVAAAAGMVFGTNVWVLMVKVSGQDGGLPVGPHQVLLAWVPVLLGALVLYAVRLRKGFPEDAGADGVEMALVAGLLAGGVLQTYLAWKMLVAGTVAPYAFKSLYFITFPVASLLLLCWAKALPVPALARLSIPAWAAVAVVLGGTLLYRWNKDEPAARAKIRMARPGSAVPYADRLPAAVCSRLRESSDELAGHFYFDPEQLHGSYYANMAALRVPLSRACAGYVALNEAGHRITPESCEVLGRMGFVGVLLPDWADPARDAPGLGPAVKVGRYWKCPLPDRLVAHTGTK